MQPAERLREQAAATAAEEAQELDGSCLATVIIATRNRCEHLKRCLASVLQMIAVPGNWEVLVVDNNSTDATVGVIRKFGLSEVPVRYLSESRRGKSVAVNRGIANSRGAIVAFTDDDCIPDKFWLSKVLETFAADPELSVLGGRVELYDERDQAISVVRCNRSTEISRYRVFEALFGPAACQETYGSVIGANMAVRRNTFSTVGLFDAYLAPGSAQPPLCSEDSDFVYRACRSGLKVAYSPEPVVYHNHGRRTDSELDALRRVYNRGRGAFYLKHTLAGDVTIAKRAYWELEAYCKGLLSRRSAPSKRASMRGVMRDLFEGMASQLRFLGRNRTGGPQC